jgi:hypothetical protein
MSTRSSWSFGIIGCVILLVSQVIFWVPGGVQVAAAAPCPTSNGQEPLAPGGSGALPAPVSPGAPSALPDTGAGGGVDFCAQNPDQCPAASADNAAASPRVAFVGSSPGRGAAGLLLLAVALRQPTVDACGQAAPGNPMSPGSPGGSLATSPAIPPAPIPCPPLPGPPPLPNSQQVALSIPVPYPNIWIGVNPSPLGLTGMPSWFWIQGYNGSSFGAGTRVDVPPQIPAGYPASCPQPPGASLTVAVQFAPSSYNWMFGDQLTTSTLTTTSLGTAYPQRSDIQHLYEYTSLGRPDGFPVRVTARFRAQYQANGSPWQALPDVAKTYTRDYPVQQAQPVLVNGR